MVIKKMSEVKKPKFAQRMIRATFNGMAISFLLFIVVYFFATAVNMLAGSTIFNPTAWGIFSFALGEAGSIGIELSKDLES